MRHQDRYGDAQYNVPATRFPKSCDSRFRQSKLFLDSGASWVITIQRWLEISFS